MYEYNDSYNRKIEIFPNLKFSPTIFQLKKTEKMQVKEKLSF